MSPAIRGPLAGALRFIFVTAAVLQLLAPGLLGGEVYRWRDADGVRHFADTPPDVPADKAFSMDMDLYQRAVAAGKPVFGLESAEEQLAVFDRMPMKNQLAMLHSALAPVDPIPAMQARMIETYLSGDLHAIAALADEMAREDASGLNRRFLQRLNDDRNDRMLTRMIPHIDRGGAFIAVGALHLTGERGLLRQLRGRGYRLSPVN